MTVEQMRALMGRLPRTAIWLHDSYSTKCTNPDDCQCGPTEVTIWLTQATDLLSFAGDE